MIFSLLLLAFISWGWFFSSPAVAVTDPLRFSELRTVAGSELYFKEQTLAQTIVLFMLSLVALVSFLGLLWGGFLYLTSLGEDEKIKTAKRIIVYTIIGLLLTVASFIILQTLTSFFAESSA